MTKTTDTVLNDLKRVGAVGGLPKTPAISESLVTEVEIEKGPPSVSLRDLRGGRTVEAVDEAVACLDDAVRGLEGVREALVRLRRVWEPVEEADDGPGTVLETPETVLRGSETPEAPSTPSLPQELQEADPEAVARARESARRKILGEDIPSEQRAADEDEDDTPYVGQTRALPPGQEPEEISLGVVGTTKPSFPTEG